MCQQETVVAAAAALCAAAARADTINVEPGDSIQDAIDIAVDGDEIVVAPATYTETIDLLGKAITVRSSGGPLVTTINGQEAGSVVTATSGEGPDTVLQGFTITGGTGDPTPGFTVGGGMTIGAADPTVRTCVFLDNTADVGGGIFVGAGGVPMIIDCLFVGNQALGGGGLLGDLASPKVLSCQFIGNTGSSGGGMFLGRGAPLIVDCTFFENTAQLFFGGGLLNANGNATVVNCLFARNSANQGGGMANAAGTGVLNLVNCTFTENTATTAGGGMSNSGSAIRYVSNCVFWANADAGGMDESAQIDQGNNAVVNFTCIQGGWSGAGSNNIDSDPLFADPSQDDFRLSAASNCIDAADNAAVPDDIATDLDGNPRILDVPETPDCQQAPGACGNPPVVDMGAYESLGGGCLAIASQEVICHADGSTFTFNAEGLSGCTGETLMLSFTASGGAVGEELCVTFLVEGDDGGFCCTTELCFTVPDCLPPTAACDLDGDGVVGILDLLALLNTWGTCGNCGGCPADFDENCDVGVTDLLELLAEWS